MGHRRESRELALQVLYLIDTCGMDVENAFKASIPEPVMDSIQQFARHLVTDVIQKKEDIDAIITQHVENWNIERLTTVDRNILRLSISEILFDTNIPITVIIDEAIEIARVYSTADSGKFVNGILDRVKEKRK